MFVLNDFWNILNYLGGTSVLNLDTNTQVLASSEKSVSQSLFENTIDQIPHMTDDYKRLKSFLVDWYAAHRTIISTQKQAHDVFSLPNSDLTELLKSFGFIFSTTSLSFLTKANFFLDLVSLYKVKGTPQTLIDVLQYFGMSDIDLAEYWLEKDDDGNLVFKSERYLPPGVIDIPFSDIAFREMVQDDPHWMLSESQVNNLISSNNIALPSKSPYFSIRPRYNVSELNTIMSVVSRYVQDDYLTYIGGGTLVKDIQLTKLNFYVSFLDLYLGCVYTFNEYYTRTTGSSDQLFYCYDGTNIPRIEIIMSQYDNLTSRVTSSLTENDSRLERESKILNFYDLFTRDISTNFLTSYNTAGNILQTINNQLYSTINAYILAGNGSQVLNYLINDLNSWIISNIGGGYPNIATTILGLGSLLDLNKIINFFKPYHARMIKLEFALIIQDPLLDSIVMEDQVYDYPTEIIVDFDVADSTACIVCSDSTCVSHHSRERYDCGSQFDIGASIDSLDRISIQQTLSDQLNFHDSTTSNAYEQILFVDTTSLDSTCDYDVFCGCVSVSLAGGWANFDGGGIFDAQHGNDLVQICIEDIAPVYYSVGTWSTTTSLLTARGENPGSFYGSALLFGGRFVGGGETQTTSTHKWDGSSWATTSSLNTENEAMGSCGDDSDGLSICGNDIGSSYNLTEKWNGSIWATTTNTNVNRKFRPCSVGTTTDAIVVGGGTTSGSTARSTEKWNGSTWSTTTVIDRQHQYGVMFGTPSIALCCGGHSSGASEVGTSISDKWTSVGSQIYAWTTTTAMTTAVGAHGGFGDDGDTISVCGNTGSWVNDCNIWNGSTWATTTAAGESKDFLGSCGTTTNGLIFCGDTTGPSFSDKTEKWNGSTWATTSVYPTQYTALQGCGTTSSSLGVGGIDTGGSAVNKVNKWNGSAWATTTVILTTKCFLSVAGSTSFAIQCAGGTTGAGDYSSIVERWNGSTWATTTSCNVGRNRHGMACNSPYNDSLIFGGAKSGATITDEAEKWDGSVWSTTSALNVGRYQLPGSGSSNINALAFAGRTSAVDGYVTTNEKITQTWITTGTWATTTDLNYNVFRLASAGSSWDDAIIFGGMIISTSDRLDRTDRWDGSTWTTTGSMNVSRFNLSGSGSYNGALAMGGNTDTGVRVDTNERWRIIQTTVQPTEALFLVWTKIAGGSIRGSWDDSYHSVKVLEGYDGKLYAGIGKNTSGTAEFWSYDLTSETWTKVAGDTDWGSPGYEFVYSLEEYNGKMYVGFGQSTGDADVWEYNIGSPSWTKIGGDGVNSSWAAGTFETVWDLLENNGILYAAIGNDTGDAEVWAYNVSGSTWTKIGGDGVNGSWNTDYERAYSLEMHNSKLCAGLGFETGDAEVWEYDISGTSWTKIGGDGVNGSWNTDYERVASLKSDGSSLYAGLGAGTGDAEVWKYSSGSWTKIGGDGVNGSWTSDYEFAYAMEYIITNNKLYTGLGNTVGDAEIWEYDINGGTWTKVAGDGVNRSWFDHTMVYCLHTFNNNLYSGNGHGPGTGYADVWEGDLI